MNTSRQMQEIKFRGKCDLTGEWVYGSLVRTLNEICIVPEGIRTLYQLKDYNQHAMGCGLEDRGITDRYEAMEYGWKEGTNDLAHYYEDILVVDPETVGEFSGRKDKNGKEIYEGDIDADGNIIKIDVATFWLYKASRKTFSHYPDGCYPLWKIDTERFADIVGNIIENPELIPQ